MTRFADELRGSEGMRCMVIDWRDEEVKHVGVIERWDDASGRAIVRYDNGERRAIRFPWVELLGEEKP